MKALFAVSAIVLATGCATQPSTYTDTSTPDQRNIQATGAAATEAARSNSSQNANIKTEGLQLTQVSQPQSRTFKYMPHGNIYVYFPDGSRDFDMERELIYAEDRNKYNYRQRQHDNSYTGYYVDEFKRRADVKIRHKIRKESQRLVDKIF
jgi:hypothetical protein